jgi:hypothetical protein
MLATQERTTMTLRIGHISLLVVSAAACDPRTELDLQPVEDPDVGSSFSTEITVADGGVLTSASGAVTLTVPPGAVEADVTLTVNVVEGTDDTITAIYEFGPDGLTFRAQPTLEITYAAGVVDLEDRAPSEIPAIALETADGWEPVAGSHMDADGTLSADVWHFSRYAGRAVLTPPSPPTPQLWMLNLAPSLGEVELDLVGREVGASGPWGVLSESDYPLGIEMSQPSVTRFPPWNYDLALIPFGEANARGFASDSRVAAAMIASGESYLDPSALVFVLALDVGGPAPMLTTLTFDPPSTDERYFVWVLDPALAGADLLITGGARDGDVLGWISPPEVYMVERDIEYMPAPGLPQNPIFRLGIDTDRDGNADFNYTMQTMLDGNSQPFPDADQHVFLVPEPADWGTLGPGGPGGRGPIAVHATQAVGGSWVLADEWIAR